MHQYEYHEFELFRVYRNVTEQRSSNLASCSGLFSLLNLTELRNSCLTQCTGCTVSAPHTTERHRCGLELCLQRANEIEKMLQWKKILPTQDVLRTSQAHAGFDWFTKWIKKKNEFKCMYIKRYIKKKKNGIICQIYDRLVIFFFFSKFH